MGGGLAIFQSLGFILCRRNLREALPMMPPGADAAAPFRSESYLGQLFPSSSRAKLQWRGRRKKGGGRDSSLRCGALFLSHFH